MSNEDEMMPYLDGEKLWGDDFSPDEIEQWYNDEKKGYYNLIGESDYKYGYHALNYYYGFKHIPNKTYEQVLGIGSAYGDEFKPIINMIDNLSIVEHSDFKMTDVFNVPTNYVKPKIQGNLPFNDNYFDLITCFGVLHHIPNVSDVINEFYRCLKEDGYALIREPIISMGNWNKPRNGLSLRERGIPISIFRKIIIEAGFKILHENLCLFPILSILNKFKINFPVYNHLMLVYLDSVLSTLTKNNIHYHASNTISKLSPSSIYFVVQK